MDYDDAIGDFVFYASKMQVVVSKEIVKEKQISWLTAVQTQEMAKIFSATVGFISDLS